MLSHLIKVGNNLEKEIKKLIKLSPIINDIYGKGLMIGVKCNVPNIELAANFRKKGLLVVPASNNVIRLLPPLNVTIEEAKKAGYFISEAIREFK